MTIMIHPTPGTKTKEVLSQILTHALQGEQVQFLVDPMVGPAAVQRLRVELSRSRKRNEARGKKIQVFSLKNSFYPYTDASGKRHTCVVMWIEKRETHQMLEALDDLMER